MSGQRVTLQAIALATGFSVNTVSRALRDSPKISEATRKLIQKKAEEMGYVPNLVAATLRLGHSRVLALVVENLINPFFGMIFDYVDHAAEALGYDVIVFCSHGTEQGEIRALQNARQHGCDGVILLTCAVSSAPLEFLRSNQMPFVLLMREIPGQEADCVLCDEAEGGREAVRYLCKAGFTHLLYADDFQPYYSIHRRLEGFLEEAKRTPGLSMEWLHPETSDALQANRDVARRIAALFRAGERPGVVAFCDMRAHGLLAELYELAPDALGIIGLVGFDNIDAIMPSSIPLSSVGADYVDMCGAAVRLLHQRLQGDASPCRRLEYAMFVKER